MDHLTGLHFWGRLLSLLSNLYWIEVTSMQYYNDTTTILKTFLIMTLLITIANERLHISFLFNVISKVIYKLNVLFEMSLHVISPGFSVISIVTIG